MEYVFDCFYPFDGHCTCSFSSNVELRFEDGVSLHAHSNLLALASPVLQSKLRLEGDVLLLPNERSDVWRVILNCIYPCGALRLRTSSKDLLDDPLTSAVFKTCVAYKLDRVASLLDGALAAMVQRRDDCLRYSVKTEDPEAVDMETTARKSVGYAREFLLPDTMNAAKQLVQDQFLRSIEECRTPPPKRTRTPAGENQRRTPSPAHHHATPRFSGTPSLAVTPLRSPRAPRLSGRDVLSEPPNRRRGSRSGASPLYSLRPSRRRASPVVDRVQCPNCFETFQHLRRG